MNTRIPSMEEARRGRFSGGGQFSAVHILKFPPALRLSDLVFGPNGEAPSLDMQPVQRAVKVSTCAHADAWLWFALWALQNKGREHVPTVHGLKIDVDDNSFVAVLDVMHEIADIPIAERLNLFRSMDDTVAEFFRWKAYNVPFTVLRDMDHEYNWMVMDDEPFITDPICMDNWRALRDEKTDVRYRLEKLVDYIHANNLPVEVV